MKKSKVFTFRAPPDLEVALEYICREYDIKLSEFLYRAVRSKANECLKDLEASPKASSTTDNG